jgi:hypothetical protein
MCSFFVPQVINVSYAANRQLMKAEGTLVSGYSSMLDDFNDGNEMNNWLYNTFSGGLGGSILPSYPSIGAKEGTRCLKLNYSVPNPAEYVWYTSKLGEENASLSNFNGIVFWVKGDTGGETLKAEMKTLGCNSAGRSNASIYINDFISGGVITTSWQKVTIPMANFANISNFSKLNEFTLVFEHDQSVLNSSPLSGAVYVDAIKFTNCSSGFDPVIQDYFSDSISRNALGGNMGWAGGGGGSATATWNTTNFLTAPSSMKISYDVTAPGSFSFVYSLFGGGSGGATVEKCNFTNYNYLSFCAKAGRVTTNIKIKIELDTDDSWPPYCAFYCIGIRTNWRQYDIPLNGYMDKTNMAKVVWVMEYGQLQAADRNTSIYIDNVKLIK